MGINDRTSLSVRPEQDEDQSSPCVRFFAQLPSKSPELSEVDMILQDDSPADEELQEEEEEEIEVDGEASFTISTAWKYIYWTRLYKGGSNLCEDEKSFLEIFTLDEQ